MALKLSPIPNPIPIPFLKIYLLFKILLSHTYRRTERACGDRRK